MTQTGIIEDANGTTGEVADLGDNVELAVTGLDFTCISLVLTPRQARALAQQLLAQADATEYGEEA